MTETRSADPPFTGLFVFSVDGLTIGSFQEVSGLSVQVAVEELTEGGQNHYVHRFPGRLKWPNLTLKRGITDSDALFSWLWQTSGEGFVGEGNKVEPRNGSIKVLGQDLQPVRTWDFEHAFPVKWSGPKLAASSKELAVEELEVCHRGFRRH